MKQFSCRDVGVDCDWQTSANSDEEILQQAEQHGREKHNIQQMSPEMREKIRSKIQDKQAA